MCQLAVQIADCNVVDVCLITDPGMLFLTELALQPDTAVCTGAMMGFSSLAVMANSMLLHFEAGRVGNSTARAIKAAHQSAERVPSLTVQQHVQPDRTAREPQTVSG